MPLPSGKTLRGLMSMLQLVAKPVGVGLTRVKARASASMSARARPRNSRHEGKNLEQRVDLVYAAGLLSQAKEFG